MKLHISGENYLKTIYFLQQKHGAVYSVDIARALNISKPSVCNAVHILQERGYLEIGEGHQLKLTESGVEIGEQISERYHFFLNLFTKIGVDKTIAAEDACHMEHALSKESFDALRNFIETYAIANPAEPVNSQDERRIRADVDSPSHLCW